MLWTNLGKKITNYTPLRYPGGKSQLLPYFQKLIANNKLKSGHYIEPFCGGAGLALGLLLTDSVSAIHLNDYDRAIYAFWYSCIRKPDALCSLIETVPCTMDTWYLQRETWLNRNKAPLLNLGFATFFLNRVNRSGILKAGVIGGKQQAGTYKLDARYNKDGLIKRIQTIGKLKSRIGIYNLDALDFMSGIQSQVPKNSLVYLDPPYVEKGPGLYTDAYKEADHRRLATWVQKKLKLPWIMSYDSHPLIKECYKASAGAGHEIDLAYSAHASLRKGKELMYFSKSLSYLQI